MTRLTPDPRILALAESNEPDCGKEFNPGLCRTRHLAAKAREARGLTHGPCAYCPLILKHLGIVTKSADKPENPTCPTCGNELTQNGFCRSCHASDIQAKEAAKRPMCKTCGLRAPRKGFSICTNCLCKKDKPAIEPDKPQTQEEPKPMESKPIPTETKRCIEPNCSNIVSAESASGRCRSCSAKVNDAKAHQANRDKGAKSRELAEKIAAAEPQRCPKCGKKLTRNGYCYTCAAHEREAKKGKKAVCKGKAPKVTQEKSNVTLPSRRCEKCGKKLTKNGFCYTCAAVEREIKKNKKRGRAPKTVDLPGVGSCPEPAADTIHAKAPVITSVTIDGFKINASRGKSTVERMANAIERMANAMGLTSEASSRPSGGVLPPHPESIYRRALRHYGDRNQIFKTAEEASELSAAIMRYMGASDIGLRSSPLLALVEELADVEIMCQQMRLVFGDQPVDAAKRQKLERLERRLEE